LSALSRHFRELAEQEKAAAERRLAAAADLESGAFYDKLFEITNCRTRVIMILALSGETWTTMELSHSLGTQHQNISQSLTSLKKMGLVEKSSQKKWVISNTKNKGFVSPLFLQLALKKKVEAKDLEDHFVINQSEQSLFYLSPKWKRLRDFVLKRDDYTCQRCGVRRTEKGNMHVHHVISYSFEEYRLNPENLIILCESCHCWVHGENNVDEEFLKRPAKKQSKSA